MVLYVGIRQVTLKKESSLTSASIGTDVRAKKKCKIEQIQKKVLLDLTF